MEIPLLCMLAVFAGVIPAQSSILNLNKMVKQVTGKIAVFSYWPYGCHCGLGGRGQPKDATDWCCHAHDCCYHHLKYHKCHTHWDHYSYTFSQGNVQCSDKGGWCEQQLCACDKEVASCLRRNLDTYKKHLRYYWRPRCKGQTPKC
ncbi:Group IID secretory phospholipase A2 [Camelus dromedarius]|uniref:Phospholipase A2 n=3 Tax=Camelus TaxID=9836 RepID=T0MHB6_CAMFR|nr:group IID secretory phospholipase A2 [Camelus ferus]XP_010955738.1 group IID secretory phospholipase A2 [Camelus bactrianus]XP_010978096.1 group IID secretory phospholipase A2 [Camelus dromedarius]EQB78641.1 group IID secretory phospholipase A2-like protein [Camelus ferus]KAB1268751.1 Group IID secretory phospholipase A2 [Camelus dromedarius]